MPVHLQAPYAPSHQLMAPFCKFLRKIQHQVARLPFWFFHIYCTVIISSVSSCLARFRLLWRHRWCWDLFWHRSIAFEDASLSCWVQKSSWRSRKKLRKCISFQIVWIRKGVKKQRDQRVGVGGSWTWYSFLLSLLTFTSCRSDHERNDIQAYQNGCGRVDKLIPVPCAQKWSRAELVADLQVMFTRKALQETPRLKLQRFAATCHNRRLKLLYSICSLLRGVFGIRQK